MNILPKKRWHVRTKENIARVRKDEAEAAEKERLEQCRIENADREARLRILKDKSKQKLLASGVKIEETERPQSTSAHVNLFDDIEHAHNSTNKDHDREVTEKKEEYEKKIGYLTYLGQDTNEALGKKNWYEVPAECSRYSRSNEVKATYEKLVLRDAEGKPKKQNDDCRNGEVSWKSKQRLDPLNSFKEYCDVTLKFVQKKSTISDSEPNIGIVSAKSKVKKHKKHKKMEDKEKKIKLLRRARLQREQEEKKKTELFLKRLSGDVSQNVKVASIIPKVKPKYNSQFNPEIARQNFQS